MIVPLVGMKVGMKLVIMGIAQLNMQVHLLMCLIRNACRQSNPIKQKPKGRQTKPVKQKAHMPSPPQQSNTPYH